MLEKFISYFAQRHLMTNFFLLAVFIGGVFAWQNTSKEELPDFTFDRVRISVTYPGAPAEDVELLVTKPIEEEIRGLDGVYLITSNSSVGSSNITVELEQDLDNMDEVITEIRNTVLDVRLPDEVIDDPRIRVFETSKKAIMDVALIHKGYKILDLKGRTELQAYGLALENQMVSLPEVHSMNRDGYLQPEIQVNVYPDRLQRYRIPFNTVMREIRENHIRKPAGTLEDVREPKVTLLSELDTPEKLKQLIIQGGFEGQVIELSKAASVEWGFEKTKSITKVNGHEAIMFNVVKNSQFGILQAREAVLKGVERFRKNNLEGTPIEIVLLDDESIDVRNRLHIISVNGVIGFILILASLFIFLNKRSGFWVALGIPFTLCFTMVFASFFGMTINGITLAAVIIVMGMIVDDAIVVAENISRLEHQGVHHKEAVIKGTSFVVVPIVASIVTTCVAFIPLFFFEGHFGNFVSYIPPIIFLMLGASLIESIIILPGHMGLRIPFLDDRKKTENPNTAAAHWFDKVEEWYGGKLEKILHHKKWVFVFFGLIMLFAFWFASSKMKFVMFPNEETRDIVLSGKTDPGSSRYETAAKVQEIEDIFGSYLGKEVVGWRTQIAQSRRGSAVEDNRFRMIVEIVPEEERDKSANQLVKEFEEGIAKLEGFQEVRFRKSRWGQDSGSPIEVIIQQNKNDVRSQVAEMLKEKMSDYAPLKNVEIEDDFRVPEYRIDIDREKIKRLSIAPADVASTFRAALEGTVLYEFFNGDEDVHVRFSIVDEAKNNIEKVLNLPVENRGSYLVPLRNIVTVEKLESPNAIARRDLKRTTLVYADMKEKRKETPLDVAEYLEAEVFPSILRQFPTTSLSFGGEIEDTRESKRDFRNAIIMVIFLIYTILAILFDSLFKPFIIMLAIPFGVVGVILTFAIHGKLLFGFFAAVGALGLAGVVINDSIILLVKLAEELKEGLSKEEEISHIARVSQTRLRAVLLTTLTTVVGVLPTAYGWGGSDAMLEEMMLALAWGLVFGTLIILILIPSVYSLGRDMVRLRRGKIRA